MIRNLFLAFSLIGLFFEISVAWANEKAIVVIYTTLDRGSIQRSQGTGFFISQNGTFITAYHVIEGAIEIDVFDYKGRKYENIKIQQIDAENDLAILRLKTNRKVPFLKLSIALPDVQENLQVIGHPRGILNQVLRGHTTQSGLLDAKAISSANGKPIFASRKTSIDIIPLDITVYTGMSGAPVINENGEVVGVLSGSFQQGGSFTWAIPTKQIYLLQDRPSRNQKIDEMEWPKLTLMASGWVNLTRSYRFNGRALTVLQNFYRELSRIERFNQAMQLNVGEYFFLYGVCISVDSGLEIARSRGPDFRTGRSPTSSERLKIINEFVNGELGQFEREEARKTVLAINRRLESEEKIRSMISRLDNWLLQSNLPEKELKRFEKTKEKIFRDFPELSVESLEVAYEVDISAVRSFMSSIQNRQTLRFTSERAAEKFKQNCYHAIETANFYGSMINYLPRGNPLNNEINMFKRYYNMMNRLKEYVIYMPQ